MNKIIVGLILTLGLIPRDAEPVAFDTEEQCLAANLYFEARGESTAGVIAVGQVTINRMNSVRFPNSICEVIHEGKTIDGKPIKNRCQFSWYCDGVPDAITDVNSYERVEKIAKYLLTSDMPDITDGALFFHNTSINPEWKRTRIARIGKHVFYR